MKGTMLEPLSFLAGTERLGNESEGWTLAEFGETGVERSFVHEVVFEKEFTEAPVVQVSLSGFDVSETDCLRLAVEVENIRASGFALRIRTWLHTRVFWTSVSWLALGR
jgi:hypothetical protein